MLCCCSTSSGTFKVLAEGEGPKSARHVSTDKAGSLTKVVQLERWLQLCFWMGKDYKSDLDGNGLIVGGSPTNFHHQLVLLIFNKKGIVPVLIHLNLGTR